MSKIIGTPKMVKLPNGNVRVVIETAEKTHWASIGQWKASGASNNLDLYAGGNIEPRYFEKGEMLFDGVTECTANDTILHSISVSGNPQVLAEAKVAEDRRNMEEVSDMSALFARKRAEEKAKQAAQPKATALVEE